MTVPTGPTPDKIMQLITGDWATAILGSAAKHGIFNAREGGGEERINLLSVTSPRFAEKFFQPLTAER